MLHALLIVACISQPETAVRAQDISLRLEPASHRATYTLRCDVEGEGQLVFRLHSKVALRAVFLDDQESLFTREPAADGMIAAHDRILVNLTGDERTLVFLCEATFEQDFARGELPGAIHNLSVDAHVGVEGVFLADGSAWHPQWIDAATGVPNLVVSSISIEPIDGWAFVCSGEPKSASPTSPRGAGEVDEEGAEPRPAADKPVWSWRTPRPVEGVAVAGAMRVIRGRVHETAHGPVEVVMHATEDHAELAPDFLDAACSYLDLYVPLLGSFPYKRFTIAENFFSSGFAYPGFTLLGPQVVAMAPRSFAPGYLDHELVHNWFGNGVYVDPADGNWCEAVTSYCANYYRRIESDGEDAGRSYRRGIVMRVSADPSLDNGPVGDFGRVPRTDRFVGYEKGSFAFMMLEHGPGIPPEETDRTAMFRALKRFATEFMGRRATWDDIRRTIEAEWGESREDFFHRWVRTHNVPLTPDTWSTQRMATFRREFFSGDELLDIGFGGDDLGSWREIDPEFLVYRLVPPVQVIPTLAGAFGPGGVKVVSHESRPEVASLVQRLDGSDEGENLLLIGEQAIASHADLVLRSVNPIDVGPVDITFSPNPRRQLTDDEREERLRLMNEGVRGFTTWSGDIFVEPDESVLHTMPHPEKPGRFITVFHANGDAGWSRLRLITFYTRETTVVWKGEEPVKRLVFEPSRRLRAE